MINKFHEYHTIQDHVSSFFRGHEIQHQQWTLGPMKDLFPSFRVLQIGPGPICGNWVYVSLGTFEIEHQNSSRLEFLIVAPKKDLRHVELLTMAAFYHQSQQLGLGHTLPIGQPWLPKSSCTHMLVSRPYPFGPNLEICSVNDQHIHIYWLLPITESEKNYAVSNGQEALEQLFDQNAIEYWKPKRKAVV